MAYNNFIWKGHKYMCGSVDVESGKIMECHTYKQMKEADFHSDFAFSYKQSSAINLGKSVLFGVYDKGLVLEVTPQMKAFYSENFNKLKDKKNFILESLGKQIKILDEHSY